MSGDNLHHPQNPKFYTDHGRRTYEQHSLCSASQAMNEIKDSRFYDTSYILEIESLFVNARYRTGSPMQE